jgi:hypothetical protein
MVKGFLSFPGELKMSSIVADEKMLSLLSHVTGVTEIRDPNGKTIGFFAPAPLENADLRAKVAAHISPEELRRRRESKLPGHTTREVLEHLKTLTTDERALAHLQGVINEVAQRDRCDTP